VKIEEPVPEIKVKVEPPAVIEEKPIEIPEKEE
jgi:hypothetical protein